MRNSRKIFAVILVLTMILASLGCINASSVAGETKTSQAELPDGWKAMDIYKNKSDIGLPGSTSYKNGAFSVTAAGYNIWYGSDGFHYVYKQMSGDGEITARVKSMDGTHVYAKAGIMVREKLTANSKMVVNAVEPYSMCQFVWRSKDNGGCEFAVNEGAAHLFGPYWVKLVRKGENFIGYESADGKNWTLLYQKKVEMAKDVYVGLAVSSLDIKTYNHVVFDNVSLSTKLSDIKAVPLPRIKSSLKPVQGNIDPKTGWKSADIFNGKKQSSQKGGASLKDGVFTVSGAGDVWNRSDSFHYVYKPFSGDGEVVVRVKSMTDTDMQAKAGIMFREKLANNSKNVFMCMMPYATTDMQCRLEEMTDSVNKVDGEEARHETVKELCGPYWLKLVRKGDTFTSYDSEDGKTWYETGAYTVKMTKELYVGLAVASIDKKVLCTAVFDNLGIKNTN